MSCITSFQRLIQNYRSRSFFFFNYFFKFILTDGDYICSETLTLFYLMFKYVMLFYFYNM